ncbi:ethanolamine utilization acetate kinase EutP [Escherichia coli]
MDKERIIQEFVPGKQVTLAHLIAHPGEELAKKIGVPDAGAIGIMTLTPGETAMIAGDLALKAADVHIGFLDRFSGALVIYGSVGAVEEALSQTVSGLGRLLNYTLARKTQAVEFNDNGDIDTPGEYFSHPRWYHALITTLQDVDMLIYVHGANDPESRLPAGLLDIGVSKRQIAVISKTDMPDADVAATRKLLLETGFEEPIFELNSHDPQSVQQLVDYLASLTKQEEAGEKTHHSE